MPATTFLFRGPSIAFMGSLGHHSPVLSPAGTDWSGLGDEEVVDLLGRVAEQPLAEDLFAELFRRYERRVRGWCERFTADREASIDLTQEVFLKAYRHLDGFRCDSRFSTWLYAITRNHCRNSTKQRSAEPVELDEAMADRLPDEHALEPYAACERGQACRLLWELMATALDPLEARIMTLHYAHEVPLAAITERLSLSNRSGAKAYIVSARRKLSTILRRQSQAPRASTGSPGRGWYCGELNGWKR